MGAACVKSPKVKPAVTKRVDIVEPEKRSLNATRIADAPQIRRESGALVAGRHVTPTALQLPESSILAAEGGDLLQGLFQYKKNGFSLCSKEMKRPGLHRLASKAGMFPKAEHNATLAEGTNCT